LCSTVCVIHKNSLLLHYTYIACLFIFLTLYDLNLLKSGRVSVKSGDYRNLTPTSVLQSADLGVGNTKPFNAWAEGGRDC